MENTMRKEHIKANVSTSMVLEEVRNIADIGFPVLAMGILNYLKNMVSVACMGRLGGLELAGGALAIGFTNITGYSVLSGLAIGMEPICTQAFGSKNYSILSITLQRMIILLLFTSIPIGVLWIYLEPLMLFLHQEPQVVHIASLYCRFAVPDLIANSILHPLRIYIRSRGTAWPLLWCNLLATLLHAPITIFFTFHQHLGIQGIAISTFTIDIIFLLFLLCYINYSNNEGMPLSKPLLQNSNKLSSGISSWEEWGLLIRLAFTSCLAVCLEWWWYELMTLMSGYLNKPQVALSASAIVIQTTSFMYTLPSALSSSISVRVGNELGAGRPHKARLAAAVAITLAFSTSVFGLLLTTIGRRIWARVFTNQHEVLELTVTILPIIGLCELANCPQTTGCGVLRGSARPSISAIINFCSFYLLGTPVALALAFFWKQGFLGLCYGLLAAQLACLLSISAVVYQTDWENQSLRAKVMVGESIQDQDDSLPLKCGEDATIC